MTDTTVSITLVDFDDLSSDGPKAAGMLLRAGRQNTTSNEVGQTTTSKRTEVTYDSQAFQGGQDYLAVTMGCWGQVRRP